MSYLLIPHSPTQPGQAIVWAGVINEPRPLGNLALRSNAGEHPLGQWTTLDGNGFTFSYQRVNITTLNAGQSYAFQLTLNDSPVADCQLRTLPDQLPRFGESEFMVLLASCFCSARDTAGSLGWTFHELPALARPDIKILSGDQVYLDDPATHFLAHRHSPDELLSEHFANYVRTWSQSGLGGGFSGMLKNGLNYFSSDDHEFWNNAPSWATVVRDTWTAGGRRDWMMAARSLYQAFQTDQAVVKFDIGNLSFFIADTRINRDDQRQNFMTQDDLGVLGKWVEDLKGLGVLVIGQPILSDRAGFKGNVTDWNLPDYAQYADLVRALSRTQHSILILTGDVHYGRVAACKLRPNVELVEIISSPTALVNKLVGGKWHKAPDRFPAFDVAGAPPLGVTTEQNFTLTDNHFLTLGFSSVGPSTHVRVNAWPVTRDGNPVKPTFVMERTLS